jgi:hypothetical protein
MNLRYLCSSAHIACCIFFHLTALAEKNCQLMLSTILESKTGHYVFTANSAVFIPKRVSDLSKEDWYYYNLLFDQSHAAILRRQLGIEKFNKILNSADPLAKLKSTMAEKPLKKVAKKTGTPVKRSWRLALKKYKQGQPIPASLALEIRQALIDQKIDFPSIGDFVRYALDEYGKPSMALESRKMNLWDKTPPLPDGYAHYHFRFSQIGIPVAASLDDLINKVPELQTQIEDLYRLYGDVRLPLRSFGMYEHSQYQGSSIEEWLDHHALRYRILNFSGKSFKNWDNQNPVFDRGHVKIYYKKRSIFVDWKTSWIYNFARHKGWGGSFSEDVGRLKIQ